MTGAYLTGNVLQVYRPNDGTYDINLTTGAQTKTMDVQMEDSWGWLDRPVYSGITTSL